LFNFITKLVIFFKSIFKKTSPTIAIIPEMHQSSLIISGRLKNLVDEYNRIQSPTREDQKFFGKWAKDLILCGTANAYIIDNGIGYFESEIVKKGIQIDADDYRVHMGLLCVSMKLYTDGLYWFESVSTATKLHIELNKWKTTTAIMRKSIANYSNILPYPSSIAMSRDATNIWCKFNDDQKDKFALLLVKLHSVVHYWGKINTITAYLECALAINQSCMFFESLIKAYCLSKSATANTKDLNSMITTEVNFNNPGLIAPYNAAQNIGNPKSTSDYNPSLAPLLSHSMSQTNEISYLGTLFHIARVTRNNAAHGLDFSNRLFNNETEFRSIVDLMLEAILATKKLK